MKVTITASKVFNGFYVTVETKRGKRYQTSYSHPITASEVLEDFKENRSSFRHIN